MNRLTGRLSNPEFIAALDQLTDELRRRRGPPHISDVGTTPLKLGRLTAVVGTSIYLRVLTNEATLAALKRTEDAIAELRKRLRPVPRSRLDERPQSGEWSAMENVRHLIFSEQHHFSPYLKGFLWKSVGVPPRIRTGERRLCPVGKDPAATVDEVFDVWVKVHDVVGARCLDEPDGLVRERLVRELGSDLRHLQLHARVIERLLGK
jgi:hypothetical protein